MVEMEQAEKDPGAPKVDLLYGLLDRPKPTQAFFTELRTDFA